MRLLRPNSTFGWSAFVALGIAIIPPLQGIVRAGGVDPQVTEQQVKAAYLQKIGSYTEWPTNRFTGPDAPVIVGVIGRPDVAAELEEIARKKESAIHGRKLVVRRLGANEVLSQCHILFIGREHEYAPLLAKLKNTSVLTVGEHADFARNGGIANFVERDGRVRFEVNQAVANAAGLQISSVLLDVVRNWGLIVQAAPRRGER